MSSMISPAWPQLHMQPSSWLYCAGTAPGSNRRSRDRTPQLGTGEQGEGGRLHVSQVGRANKKSKGDTLDKSEAPECWDRSWRHE